MTGFRIPFFELESEIAALRGEIQAAVGRTLESAWFVLGKEGQRFEDAFGDWLGGAAVAGVGNGTDALFLALRALGVQPGDKVVTVANTCVPTVAAICQTGATPVLIDCRDDTLTMDPEQLAGALSETVKAVVPVHLFGHPCDMDPILKMSREAGAVVVEDCAQAHGARYKGKPCGTLGDAAAFSFYPTKNLGAYGDGGAVVSNDPALIDKVRALRHYGNVGGYRHEEVGVNSRLDEVQAAILCVKLQHLDAWNAARRAAAEVYDAALADVPVQRLAEAPWAASCRHLYPIRTDWRDALAEHLSAQGIQTQVHYPIPIHLQPAFAHLGYREGTFPVAEAASRTALSLPLYPMLGRKAQEEVIAQIVAFVAGGHWDRQSPNWHT